MNTLINKVSIKNSAARLEKQRTLLDKYVERKVTLNTKKESLIAANKALISNANQIETEQGKEQLNVAIAKNSSKINKINTVLPRLSEKIEDLASKIASTEETLSKKRQAAKYENTLLAKSQQLKELVASIREKTEQWNNAKDDSTEKAALEIQITADKALANVLNREIAAIASSVGITYEKVKRNAIAAQEPNGISDAILSTSGSVFRVSAKDNAGLKRLLGELILVQKRSLSVKELYDIINSQDYASLRTQKATGANNLISLQTIRQWYHKAIKFGWEGLGFKRNASKSDVFVDPITKKPAIIWENAKLNCATIDTSDGVFVRKEEYILKLGKSGKPMTPQSFNARRQAPSENLAGGYVSYNETTELIDLTKSREFNTFREDTPDRHATSLNNHRVR